MVRLNIAAKLKKRTKFRLANDSQKKKEMDKVVNKVTHHDKT